MAKLRCQINDKIQMTKTGNFGFLFLLTILFLNGASVLTSISKALAREAHALPSPTLNHYASLTTQIFDREGNLIYEIHGDVNRKLTKIENIPLWVKGAFLASEDQTFYQHQGFSTRAILRAVLVNLENRALVEGASTIPQQLVRSLWLTPEKTFDRKIKELLLSVLIDARYSKDEILENFLNNIPMGFNLVGIETGAQTYFEKSAKGLSLSEAAMLTALSHSPTLLNPYTNREELNHHAQIVLQQMLAAGFISDQQLLQADEEVQQTQFNPYTPLLRDPYFSIYMSKWLEQEFGVDLAQNGGLKVYTSLDPSLQALAENVVQEYATKNFKTYGAQDLGLLAINPKTGEILAWVGGVDFARSQVDVITSPRQPGSAIKPLIYLTAFEQGFSPESLVLDEYENFGQGYTPTNYGGNVSGEWRTVRMALAASLNIPAVRTLRKIGIAVVVDKLKQLGLSLDSEGSYGLSLALGAVEVSPMQLAQGFQVLANSGDKIELSALRKIEDQQKTIFYLRQNNFQKDFISDAIACQVATFESPERSEVKCLNSKVADERAVAMVNSILSDYTTKHIVYGFGTQFKNYTLSDRPAAAKTGTSSGPKDTWTIGYTPSLLTVVWAGNLSGKNMASFADGINVAAPVWHEFMERVLRDAPVESFADYERVKPQKEFEYIK